MAIQGYKLLSGTPSPAVQIKAIELLSQDYGYNESATIDDKDLLFVVEQHEWYGTDPSEPPAPHKGVTVYERILPPSSFPPSSFSIPPFVIGIGLVGLGLGYWILRKE